MEMFKVGDIIGLRNPDGLDLLEITDISFINYKNQSGNVCLHMKMLLNCDLEKPRVNITGSIILPQQRNEIRTKEEYFEEMQSEINKKQTILNELKEKYDN